MKLIVADLQGEKRQRPAESPSAHSSSGRLSSGSQSRSQSRTQSSKQLAVDAAAVSRPPIATKEAKQLQSNEFLQKRISGKKTVSSHIKGKKVQQSKARTGAKVHQHAELLDSELPRQTAPKPIPMAAAAKEEPGRMPPESLEELIRGFDPTAATAKGTTSEDTKSQHEEEEKTVTESTKAIPPTVNNRKDSDSMIVHQEVKEEAAQSQSQSEPVPASENATAAPTPEEKLPTVVPEETKRPAEEAAAVAVVPLVPEASASEEEDPPTPSLLDKLPVNESKPAVETAAKKVDSAPGQKEAAQADSYNTPQFFGSAPLSAVVFSAEPDNSNVHPEHEEGYARKVVEVLEEAPDLEPDLDVAQSPKEDSKADFVPVETVQSKPSSPGKRKTEAKVVEFEFDESSPQNDGEEEDFVRPFSVADPAEKVQPDDNVAPVPTEEEKNKKPSSQLESMLQKEDACISRIMEGMARNVQSPSKAETIPTSYPEDDSSAKGPQEPPESEGKLSIRVDSAGENSLGDALLGREVQTEKRGKQKTSIETFLAEEMIRRMLTECLSTRSKEEMEQLLKPMRMVNSPPKKGRQRQPRLGPEPSPEAVNGAIQMFLKDVIGEDAMRPNQIETPNFGSSAKRQNVFKF